MTVGAGARVIEVSGATFFKCDAFAFFVLDELCALCDSTKMKDVPERRIFEPKAFALRIGSILDALEVYRSPVKKRCHRGQK